MKNNRVFLLIGTVLLSMIAATVQAEETSTDLLLREEVQWEPLNPLRGDKSPQAAPLWGGLKSNISTAFLVKFRDGFSSPPHIHNVTYRGVVISGLVHNDDPEAADMWMPAGSFWTQPAGEVHITAAKGETNIAYIEIDHGPYLVKPATEAFDNGERPVNIDKSNLVWLDASDIAWIDQGGAKVSFLWGERIEGQFHGAMIKLPAGFEGEILSDANTFRGVVIQGQAHYKPDNSENAKTLNAGSYFGSKGQSTHVISSDSEHETFIYVRTNGAIKIRSKP